MYTHFLFVFLFVFIAFSIDDVKFLVFYFIDQCSSPSPLKQIRCFVPQSFSVNFFHLIFILFHQQELESAHKQEKLNLEHLHEKKVGKN